jgi:hypothetical protein
MQMALPLRAIVIAAVLPLCARFANVPDAAAETVTWHTGIATLTRILKCKCTQTQSSPLQFFSNTHTHTHAHWRKCGNAATHRILGLLVGASIQQQPHAVRATPETGINQRRPSVLCEFVAKFAAAIAPKLTKQIVTITRIRKNKCTQTHTTTKYAEAAHIKTNWVSQIKTIVKNQRHARDIEKRGKAPKIKNTAIEKYKTIDHTSAANWFIR